MQGAALQSAPFPNPVAIQVLQSIDSASVLLDASRLEMMRHLENPDSASGLARKMKLPRQKVNYHLRELEREGLIELIEERRKGNCVERLMRAKARSYILAPQVLGSLGADPNEVHDRVSAAYLVSAASRAIQDVTRVVARAKKQKKRVSTLTMEVDVRFANAADRTAFSDELAQAVGHLISKYHNQHADGGRNFHLLFGAYPAAGKADEDSSENVEME